MGLIFLIIFFSKCIIYHINRAGSESVAKITPRLLEVEDNLIPSSVRTEVPVQTKNVQVQTVPSSFRVRTEVPVRTKNVQVQTDVPRRHWYNLPFPPLSPSLPSRLLPARPVVYPGPDYYQRFDCYHSFLDLQSVAYKYGVIFLIWLSDA